MQRYFVPAEQFTDDTVVLTGDDAHHAIRVMRMKVGDRFVVSNGSDREALVEIAQMDKSTVTAAVVENLPLTAEPRVEVWIAQSLPKGDKMETVVQKCTEIGAARFIPFLSARTVVQYDGRKEERRLERWQKIAKEAAEQAQRNRVPQVDAPCAWERLLQLAGVADLALICYEKEEALHFRQLLARWFQERPESFAAGSETGAQQAPAEAASRSAERRTLLLIVGPEGGFTEGEIAEAKAAGCLPISLGRRILRTETAAMVGLTCILYESGEMGGIKPCQP